MENPSIEQIEQEIKELKLLIDETKDEKKIEWYKSCLSRIIKLKEKVFY